MFRLAFSNLVQNKTRLLISVGGIGLALTLVLFFGAVRDGIEGRLTVYVDRAGADVWVSQEGVRTMHLSQSTLPSSVVDQVRAVPGVEDAVPILYTTGMVEARGDDYITYVFGVPQDAKLGQPWRIVDGASTAGPGEVIIDHAVASQSGLGVGDEATVLGEPMRIAGVTSGTSTVMSSVSFIGMEDFARARGGDDAISFVLVKVGPGESPTAVSDAIAQNVGGVTVQTRQQFASQERQVVGDMSSDIINIMNLAGFLTGLAVVALTIYIATIARRKEYGVLKAMGVRNSRLYQVVLTQALLSVSGGLAAALALTLLLSVVIPRFNELMVLTVSLDSLLRVTVIAIILGILAALLPARQIAGLEPVAVLRKG